MGKKKTQKRETATSAAPEEKAEQKAPVQRVKLDFTDEQVINAVKAVGHAATSREVSDKLGIVDADQGRAYVRARMNALIKDGKIKTSLPPEKSRATFLYETAT
jgi:hypothetical protein